MERQIFREATFGARKYWSEFIVEANKFGNLLLFIHILQVWLVNNWDFVKDMNITLALILALFWMVGLTIWAQITVALAMGILSHRIRLMELNFLQWLLPFQFASHFMIAGYTSNWLLFPLIFIYSLFYSKKIEVCVENISEQIEMERNADYLRQQTR